MKRLGFLFVPFFFAGAVCAQGLLGFPPGTFDNVAARAPASATYTGMLDLYGSAYEFYSTRGPSAAFSGALFNVCDNATGLVCADATWAGSTLTLPLIGGSACGVIVCEIAKFYDLGVRTSCGGSNCDASATHGHRATLTVSCQNSKVCAVGDGSTTCYNSAAATVTGAVPYSLSAVFKVTTATNNNSIWTSGSNILLGSGGANQFAISANGTSNQVLKAATDNSYHDTQVLVNTTTSMSVDGGTAATGNAGTGSLGGSAPQGIFADQCAAFFLAGQFLEFGAWSSDQSTNFAAGHTNQDTYWAY